MIEASRQYGPSREDLQAGAWEESTAQANTDGFSQRLLAILDSDLWPSEMLTELFLTAEAMNSREAAGSAESMHVEAEALTRQLQEVFDSVPIHQQEVEASVRVLDDFLKLPIWKQRHELYAAWIATQIHDALRKWSPRVHVYESELLFSFSGSHLATFDAFAPRLHLYSELRSAHDNPIGKGRTGGIQPDYRLLPDPISRPEGTVLVVEVKQYLSPSYRSFGEALTDYATGCPRAYVVLVNYGRLTDTVTQYVAEPVRERTAAVGFVRPGKPGLQTFHEKIRSVVTEKCAPDLDRELVGEIETLSGTESLSVLDRIHSVTLTWGEKPTDLDLHLLIGTGEGVKEVNYRHMGEDSRMPHAWLDKDVRTGFGPECIRVVRGISGTYLFAVHCYSSGAGLAGSGAEVHIEMDARTKTIRCPESGEGSWWHVFMWEPDAKRITVQNILSDARPVPKRLPDTGP